MSHALERSHCSLKINEVTPEAVESCRKLGALTHPGMIQLLHKTEHKLNLIIGGYGQFYEERFHPRKKASLQRIRYVYRFT